ncbi:MAG: EAL domain-containing protein [Methylotenera sp.]|uniref:bifunctional diguanylate cyclase/phosphodiesterase n=1 Tax=Methylotenera sp. TaxID=2051956 RepID=UPI00248A5B64|nr:EAL domain-containing protein [Methylotenera sp.]MDI1310467.1 EAL domain-containing protein [Methylotenera sp.]
MSNLTADANIVALRISESRYRRLFETAQDGILLLNAETGQIEDVNPYLIDMLGYSHTEFLGKKLWEVGPFVDMKESKVMFVELQEKGYVRYEDLPLKSKSGALIAVEFVSNSYDCEGIMVIQCNIRNITERKVAEAKAHRHMQLYAALSQCNKAIVYTTNEEALFQQVCHAAVTFGGMKMAWIGIVDEATLRVRPVASFGEGAENLQEREVSIDPDNSLGAGEIGTAMRQAQPLWCQDFMNDPLTEPWRDLGKKSGWAASASLPLYRDGRIIGVFVLYADLVNAFDKPACDLLIEMASDISFALGNFSLEAARKLAEQELRIADTAFEAQEGIIVTDANKIILRVNKSFSSLTGYSTEEVIGQTFTLFESGRQDQLFYKQMWEALSRDNYWHGEIWNRRKNGDVHPDWLTITAVTNAKGQITHYVGTYSDLSQHKKDEAEIHLLAFYDSLTNLPNRRLLMDRLQHALIVSTRHRKHVALLFMDLDNFKTLNDTKGHNIGDLLLIDAASRLLSCVREGDTVARLGGDEFVIILEELSEQAVLAATQAEEICNKILNAISLPYSLQNHSHHLTASIGVILFHNNDFTADELIKRADVSMYQAKNAGRNTIRFYDPSIQTELEMYSDLEIDLRRALTEQQFKLYYQMQVDNNACIFGAEVLIRWQHPEKGIISPIEFIPLAEDTGLILPMGHWVLEAACLQLKAWESNLSTRHLVLAVNVSAKQFHQHDFVEQVLSVLRQTGADPSHLKLELTESMLIENVQALITKMDSLKSKGIKFSLDDFGIGFSSLSYLKRLPLDQLKIDQSFVSSVHKNPSDAAIVRTVIALGQSLGLAVIAEGVETEAQRNLLAVFGCNHYQGYLFGKPVPLEEFELLLAKC